MHKEKKVMQGNNNNMFMAEAIDNNEINKLSEIRLVILGCGGFIGSHLLDHLLTNPSIEVYGWDPYPDKIAHHLDKPNFKFFQKAPQNEEGLAELESAISNANVVLNLAAICNPAEYNTRPLRVIYSNFIDGYPIVELCAKHKKWLIHFSTSEVYGRTLSSYVPNDDYSSPNLYELSEDESPLIMGPIANQRWSYACAKQLMERFIYGHHKESGLPFTIVRPLNFFGPRMDFIPGYDGEGVPRVLACFLAALLDDKPMLLVDGGTARRTIVSIHDAINAIILMLTHSDKAQNQIFNIGNRANEVTMAELAQLMRKAYAKVTNDISFLNHPIKHVSGLEFYGEGYEDCDRRKPNLEKAYQLLDWAPTRSLEEVLHETVSFYFKRYGHAQHIEDVNG
jgi:UDP-apiose/xylose synthase